MDREFIYLVIAIVGLVYGVFKDYQLRKFKKSDFIKEKRAEAYTSFMKNWDRLGQISNLNTINLLNAYNNLYSQLLQDPENSKAMLTLSEQINNDLGQIINSLGTIQSETSTLLLYSSENIKNEILDFKNILNKFIENYEYLVIALSPNGFDLKKIESYNEGLVKISKEMTKYYDKILSQMRSELGVK